MVSPEKRALPGIFRLVSSQESHAAINMRYKLRNIFDAAPNLHKDEMGSSGAFFTTASLASRLAQSQHVPPEIAYLLGDEPISVGVSFFSRYSEFTLRALNHFGVKAVIGNNGNVGDLDFKIRRDPYKLETVAVDKQQPKQQLVHGLLDCVSADLEAARREWINTNRIKAVRDAEKSFGIMLASGRKPVEIPVLVKLRA